jgi:hypothetical protein
VTFAILPVRHYGVRSFLSAKFTVLPTTKVQALETTLHTYRAGYSELHSSWVIQHCILVLLDVVAMFVIKSDAIEISGWLCFARPAITAAFSANYRPYGPSSG